MGHLAADGAKQQPFDRPPPPGAHDDEVHPVGLGGRKYGLGLRALEEILVDIGTGVPQ